MKENSLRNYYATLYEKQFPGLEYEWIRLCERFKASFNFNFESKSFDQILSEFASKSLPFSMQNTITALQCRVLLANAVAGPQELIFYAETLRKDLDEYTEGNEVHVIEILYCQTKVKVQVSLYPKDDAPQKRVIVTAFLGILFEKESAIHAIENSLVFVRKNDQFNFSNGFAQKDANEIIGFVLSEFKYTAERLLEKIKIANANAKLETHLK